MLEIDISSPEPVFEQIVSQIGLAIKNKHLRPDDRLPPIRQLAADLEINPNTVARAYLLLEESGIIETKGRAGSVITENALLAYEEWLVKLTKERLMTVWNKVKTFSLSNESSLKIWKAALREIKDEN